MGPRRRLRGGNRPARPPEAAAAPGAEVLDPVSADGGTARRCEIAAYVLLAVALLFVFRFQLVAALVAGLLLHTLLHRSARLLSGSRLSHGAARWLAAAAVALAGAGLTTLAAIGLASFARGYLGDLPGLYARMADVLDDTRRQLAAWGVSTGALEGWQTADQIKAGLADWLREHSAELRRAGGEAGRTAIHVLMGIVAAHPRLLSPPGVRRRGASLRGGARRADPAIRGGLREDRRRAGRDLRGEHHADGGLPVRGRPDPRRAALVLGDPRPGDVRRGPPPGRREPRLEHRHRHPLVRRGPVARARLARVPRRGPQARVPRQRPYRREPDRGGGVGDLPRDRRPRGRLRDPRRRPGADRLRLGQGRDAGETAGRSATPPASYASRPLWNRRCRSPSPSPSST